MTLLAEGELLAAVHALVDPIVSGTRRAYGPLPPMTTVEFPRAHKRVQIATLLVVAEAYLVADPHQVIRAALRAASDDVHGGDTRQWRAAAARRRRGRAR